jgi:hypothetical protein
MITDNLLAILRLVFFVAVGFALGFWAKGCKKEVKPIQTVYVPTQIGEVVNVSQLKTIDSLTKKIEGLKVYYSNQIPTIVTNELVNVIHVKDTVVTHDTLTTSTIKTQIVYVKDTHTDSIKPCLTLPYFFTVQNNHLKAKISVTELASSIDTLQVYNDLVLTKTRLQGALNDYETLYFHNTNSVISSIVPSWTFKRPRFSFGLNIGYGAIINNNNLQSGFVTSLGVQYRIF